jgi:hypothetical protein
MAKDVIHMSEVEATSDFVALVARVRAGAKVIIENGPQPEAVLHATKPGAPQHFRVHRAGQSA